MTGAAFFFLIAVIVLLAVVVRIVGPYSRHIYRRTRMQGPAPVGGGPTGGTWFGWFVSVLHIIGETKREEQYHYLRDHSGMSSPVELEWSPPQPAPRADLHDHGDSELPRDHQTLTGDRREWWSGRDWVRTSEYVPPSAERAHDGEQWWDGEQWQWTPGTFEPPASWAPHHAVLPRVKKVPASGSWVIEQRGHLNRRWVTPPPPPPSDRSDPPPDWLTDGDSSSLPA